MLPILINLKSLFFLSTFPIIFAYNLLRFLDDVTAINKLLHDHKFTDCKCYFDMRPFISHKIHTFRYYPLIDNNKTLCSYSAFLHTHTRTLPIHYSRYCVCVYLSICIYNTQFTIFRLRIDYPFFSVQEI